MNNNERWHSLRDLCTVCPCYQLNILRFLSRYINDKRFPHFETINLANLVPLLQFHLMLSDFMIFFINGYYYYEKKIYSTKGLYIKMRIL